jgi:hypothetical protein
MEHTFVNGANAIGRGVIRHLSKNSSSAKLLDYRVFRPSVYTLQNELKGVEIKKHQTLNAKSLEYAMEGSETVIYFTHDYPSMAFDKNAMLKATAKSAKIVGVEKLICVCPIENDFYYTEDGKDPLEEKYEAENKAMESNPNLVMLHSNLVYGEYSYLIRYITQSILAGSLPSSLSDDSTKYFPVHIEDLSKAISHSIDNFDDVKGNSFYVKSDEAVTLANIKKMIEDKAGKQASSSSGLGFSEFINEFFYGLSHDKNMSLMAKYFKDNSWDFTHDNDYFKVHDITPEHKISEFLSNQDLKEENFVYPLYSGYKNTELD